MPGIWPQYPPLPRRDVPAVQRPPLRWVATPPHGAERRPEPAEPPYDGPPAYPATPRWGFPNVLWRRPTAVPGTPSEQQDTSNALRRAGTTTATVLACFAGVALATGVVEFWRYGLLAASRSSALSSGAVNTSNALASTFALASSLIGVAAVLLALRWLLLARAQAEHQQHVLMPRSSNEVVVRLCVVWFVLVVVFALGTLFDVPAPWVSVAGPVIIGATFVGSLVVAVPVVVELEHVATGADPFARPRPSRWVLLWLACWVVNAVCAAVALWLRMSDGIQAEADAMFTTALTHLSAGALAVVTVVLMSRIRRLLTSDPDRLERLSVVGVRGAPAPELRPERPVGSRR